MGYSKCPSEAALGKALQLRLTNTTENSILFSLVNKAVFSYHGESQTPKVCTINEPSHQTAHQLSDLQSVLPILFKKSGYNKLNSILLASCRLVKALCNTHHLPKHLDNISK